MWKNVNGKLIPFTDNSRIRIKTYISSKQLNDLNNLVKTEDTHISYLLENGLKNIVLDNLFAFDKKNRLKDKVEFRITCDEEILEKAREFSKVHKLNFTDVIQASVNYINLSEVKSKEWRHRIE